MFFEVCDKFAKKGKISNKDADKVFEKFSNMAWQPIKQRTAKNIDKISSETIKNNLT
jgi:hypothetical protein